MSQYLSDLNLAARYAVSRITIWRWTREGRYPLPVRLGPNCTRWSHAEVEQWEAARAAESERRVVAAEGGDCYIGQRLRARRSRWTANRGRHERKTPTCGVGAGNAALGSLQNPALIIPPAQKNTQRPSVAALLAQLSAEFPVIAECRPLAIGVRQTLRAPDISNKLMRGFLAFHCRQRRYLEALAAGGPRYALNGEVCGEVTEPQRDAAKERLLRAAAKARQKESPKEKTGNGTGPGSLTSCKKAASKERQKALRQAPPGVGTFAHAPLLSLPKRRGVA